MRKSGRDRGFRAPRGPSGRRCKTRLTVQADPLDVGRALLVRQIPSRTERDAVVNGALTKAQVPTPYLGSDRSRDCMVARRIGR